MTDLLPRQEWARLEREFFQRFGMNTRVYEATGEGVTGEHHWCNPLCPALRAQPGAQGAICAVASGVLNARAAQERATVLDACDAGMLMVSVPVLVDGELVGIVGGCGRLEENGEVEGFLVAKASGLDEAEVERLAAGVRVMSRAEVDEAVRFLEERLAAALARRREVRPPV